MSTLRLSPWTRAFGAIGVVVLAHACSDLPDQGDRGGALPRGGSTGAGAAGRAGSSGTAGSIEIGGSGGTGGSALAGTGGAIAIEVPGAAGAAGDDDGAAGTPTVGKDDACATSSDTAEALPSVVQLVVDTSGSMDWPPGWAPVTPDDSKPPGATKWEITRDALLDAVAGLPSDLALGVTFYPHVEQEDGQCLDNEVAVPIAVLGGASSSVRDAWVEAVDAVVPEGATPTHGAYLFGLQQLAETDLPGNQFMLLLTDGTPTCTLDCECTEDNLPVDSQPLIDEAESALASGVRTFVIGSPGSEETREVLSELASEGGTAKASCSDDGPDYCHFDMTTEPDLGTALADALGEIAVSLRSCEYVIPAPPNGQTLDTDRVNVLFTPGDGEIETIGRDPSERDCDEGWQYSEDGERVVLCGDACANVRSDRAGKVEVLFGCETVMITEPR